MTEKKLSAIEGRMKKAVWASNATAADALNALDDINALLIEIKHLREFQSMVCAVAGDVLDGVVGEISEEYWCAGWMSGIEDMVWSAMIHKPKSMPLTDDQRRVLWTLAKAKGEWYGGTHQEEIAAYEFKQ